MGAPKKYRLPSVRGSSNSKFYWVLVLIALAALAWVWWFAGKSPESPTSIPKKATVRPVENSPQLSQRPTRTNAVAIPPALMSSSNPVSNSVFPRPVRDLFEAQLAMDRLGISAGSLDGKIGSQTRAALRAFQIQENLPPSSELDAATKSKLSLLSAPITTYIVTSNDLARLQPIGKTWLAKSQQGTLDFENLLELVAENSHAHPAYLRRLNPSVDWTNVSPGTVLQIPNAVRSPPTSKASFVKISLAEKILEAFDAETNLLAHFPCSIAERMEKRPVGELRVLAVAPDPNYTFDPAVFPESAEARQMKTKLVVPPGPNNPVGRVWIGLDKPGYGMHGTPSPELVGRTESHGCFRLANWNAEYLLKLVWIGMPVYVEP